MCLPWGFCCLQPQSLPKSPPATPAAGQLPLCFWQLSGQRVYRASEQDATVISLPLDFTLEQSEDSEFLLRLPISVGFFNYSLEDAGEFELPSSVGTLTVTPGFEKRWRLDENWRMEAYGDLGFGSNFDQGGNVAIMQPASVAYVILSCGRQILCG